MAKIAWLIQNLVPYHHARFEAFSRAYAGDTHLIQTTDRDAFDVLEFHASGSNYQLHTLFPGRDRSLISVSELQAHVDICLNKLSPDCLCVSGWGMIIGQCSMRWALKSRTPMVLFSESTVFDMDRSWWKEWIKSRLVQCASAALVGGKPHADYVVKLGLEEQTVFLGHNVVDNTHFIEPQRIRPERLPFELEKDPFFLICTRFGKKKNIPATVKAFSNYRDWCLNAREDRPFKLVIAGDGEMRSEIEKVIRDEGITAEVHLLGAIEYDELPWLYQNCLAFVHASTTEQWGLVVNEAMASGAPVLVSNRCGCAEDLVDEGSNGFSFDPFDPEAINSAFQKLHKTPSKTRRKMGLASREIISHWNQSRFVEGLESAVDIALHREKAGNRLVPNLLLKLLAARN